MIMSGMAETRPLGLFGCYMGLTFDLSDLSGWSRGYYSGMGAFFFFQLTETESTQATADIYEKEASIQVDYSPLREDLKVI